MQYAELIFRNYIGIVVWRCWDFPSIAEAEAFARGHNRSEGITGTPDQLRIITDIYRPSDGMVHVVTA